ncbi:MAG: Hpt domain-containing protein [Desulfovibrio sp.]|uniref:Hpt domain-containing protein n=1 Tax=Desulfovibrio porci TaxID=2605782 RepID=A0A6L5XIS1_9BACT|nr:MULTISPECIES: Hpt domain-containing protein [Desulfovibrio]MCD7983149.1 Hpt domain-containing protein [Desulfovibrio sp.]MDY3809669.1 Hpt domain-containing protein [Desulfovibrio porci]MSS26969.1 Hpt domain-containing protein [Desulfovibrio porci]
MSEEVLDWKEAIARVLNKRELYVKLLGKFIETERDSPAKVEQALQNGDTETARQLVHSTKGAAANLGAKALAAAALELEMAIKAGADTGPAMNRFDSAVTDTLVTMSAFMSQ